MESIYREARWAQISRKKENGTLEEFQYESSNGTVLYRFFKKEAGEIAGETYFDIASYRGAQGPYIQDVKEGMEEPLFLGFMGGFEKYCQKNRIIAEFAKLDPWDPHAETVRKLYGGEYYGNFYCTSLEKDFYKEEYNRRAKRSIKKAKSSGVTVQFDFTGQTAETFIKLYANTENKYHTSSYYQFTEGDIREYFRTFPDCFLTNACLNGEIIASALTVMGKDIAHYLYLGIDPRYTDLQANSLMTYETARYGKESKRLLFDMGGGIPGGGVEQFKRNFISEEGVWKYYAVKKIRNQQIYDQLVQKRGAICNTRFFPLYRG